MEEKKWCVYIHTSPSNKAYIGITSKKPKERWGKNGCKYKHCRYFWNAIRKYGWDNFTHVIFEDHLSQEEACHLEVVLINLFDTRNSDHGYNIASGGEINSFKLSEETKQKISGSRIGKYTGKENHNYGKHPYGKWRDSIINTNKTRIIKHYVLCIDTYEIFYNFVHAERKTGISRVSISMCCQGKYQTAGGYKWRRITEEEAMEHAENIVA